MKTQEACLHKLTIWSLEIKKKITKFVLVNNLMQSPWHVYLFNFFVDQAKILK